MFETNKEIAFSYEGSTGVIEFRRRGLRESAELGRIYVSVSEESIAENLMNRRNRPVDEYRKIVKAAFAEVGVEDTRFGWSQNAGCSCACSPGFISKASELRYHDVYVTVKKQDNVLNNGFVTPLEAFGLGEFVVNA